MHTVASGREFIRHQCVGKILCQGTISTSSLSLRDDSLELDGSSFCYVDLCCISVKPEDVHNLLSESVSPLQCIGTVPVAGIVLSSIKCFYIKQFEQC
jgi:hypothetical protein